MTNKPRQKYMREMGKITEEGLDKLRAIMNKEFAPREQWNTLASRDTIHHFSTMAWGDDNPLHLNEEYARKTKWGGIIAPPTWVLTCLGRGGIPTGLPGVHTLAAGAEVNCFLPIRLGDTIRTTATLTALEEKQSNFAKVTYRQETTWTFYNQDDEVATTWRSWILRVERDTARERGKYDHIEPQKWTEEELKDIWEAYDRERRRGPETLFWEDVHEGDTVPTIVKGPYTVTDMIAYKMGTTPSYTRANRLRYEYWKKHPAASYNNIQGVPDIAERVHWDPEMAQALGVPYHYDYGWQRFEHLCHMLVNWMGDDGFLKQLGGEYRLFALVGDVVWCKGKVNRKYVEGDDHLVELEVWCENQRGEVTAPGWATVLLPSAKR